MIKNILLLVLVIVTVHNETRAYRTNENSDEVDSAEERNRDELNKVIQALNGHTELENNYEKTNLEGAKKHSKKQKILKWLQERYPHEFETKTSESEVRLHFIKNPEVLDQFVKNLMTETSSSSDSSDGDRGYEVEVDNVRRNAMFRVQDGSNEEKVEPNEIQDNNNQVNEDKFQTFRASIEEQVTPFKPHLIDSEEKKELDKKISLHAQNNINIITKRFKVKSKADKLKVKSTKNSFDDEEDKVKSKEKSNTWDNSNRSKKEPKDEVWDKSIKNEPKDIDWDVLNEAPNTEGKADVISEDVPEKEELVKYSVLDETERPKRLKKNLKRLNANKDLSDNREKVWARNKKSEKFEDISPNKKIAKKRNEPKLRQKKIDWDAPRTTKDNNDDWDAVGRDWKNNKEKSRSYVVKTSKSSWKPKKRIPDELTTNNDDWDKVGRDWGKKESEENYAKTSRSSWKQKKRNPSNLYEKPSYVARIPEYHKSKGREGGGGSFFGRTPIPFIGKRGIYDDK